MASWKILCLCGHLQWKRRQGQLRDVPAVGVFECQGCGLVTPADTETLVVDYESGSLHGDAPVPIDQWRNECLMDDSRRFEHVFPSLDCESAVLDVGCGAGGFVLALQQAGFKAYGLEPQTTARDFLLGEDVSVFAEVGDMPEADRLQIGMVTAFHVLEHIDDPRSLIASLLELLPNAKRFVFEVPCSEDPLLIAYNCEAFSNFTYWSHHIHLHSKSSFENLLRGSFPKVEVSRLQRYGLANHLGWLKDGRPGGQVRLAWLDETPADWAYRSQLLARGYSDSLWAVAAVRATDL